MNKVCVIGGGAAGLMAAVSAKWNNAEVTVFERNSSFGKKLLTTGNGRCNLGNQDMSFEKYYLDDQQVMKNWLLRFGTTEALEAFHSIGLLTQERDGYIYPRSDQASSVLEVMVNFLKREKVCLKTDCFVKEILPVDGGYQVGWLYDGQMQYECFQKVICAMGGEAVPKSGSDGNGLRLLRHLGLKYKPTIPALCALKVSEDIKAIAGVRIKGKVSLYVDSVLQGEDVGEIQFTEDTISGIAVFGLSRIAGYALREGKNVELQLDFFPEYDDDAWDLLLRRQLPVRKEMSTEDAVVGLLNKKMMQYLMQKSNQQLSKALDQSRRLTFTVTATNKFDKAQVTAGGILLSEISEQFETRRYPGLYVVGETLDVDGICGGYNLHFAWLSGSIAGEAAGRSL